MTIRRDRRRRRYAAVRVVAISGAVALATMVVGGPAWATVVNSDRLTTANGDRVTVSQGDTVITSVPPLDSSPLSREFFYDGYTEITIDGPTTATAAKVTFGYQIGYPIALPQATITLTTPGVGFELESTDGVALAPVPVPVLDLTVTTRTELLGDIIPQQNLTADLKPGGITDVPIVDAKPFDGNTVKIRVAGIHGAISGAIGPVTVRPYAKAELADGDIIATYGAPVPL